MARRRGKGNQRENPSAQEAYDASYQRQLKNALRVVKRRLVRVVRKDENPSKHEKEG